MQDLQHGSKPSPSATCEQYCTVLTTATLVDPSTLCTAYAFCEHVRQIHDTWMLTSTPWMPAPKTSGAWCSPHCRPQQKRLWQLSACLPQCLLAQRPGAEPLAWCLAGWIAVTLQTWCKSCLLQSSTNARFSQTQVVKRTAKWSCCLGRGNSLEGRIPVVMLWDYADNFGRTQEVPASPSIAGPCDCCGARSLLQAQSACCCWGKLLSADTEDCCSASLMMVGQVWAG